MRWKHNPTEQNALLFPCSFFSISCILFFLFTNKKTIVRNSNPNYLHSWAGCLDQAENTTLHGPMKKESMKLLKELVLLCFVLFWWVFRGKILLWQALLRSKTSWFNPTCISRFCGWHRYCSLYCLVEGEDDWNEPPFLRHEHVTVRERERTHGRNQKLLLPAITSPFPMHLVHQILVYSALLELKLGETEYWKWTSRS